MLLMFVRLGGRRAGLRSAVALHHLHHHSAAAALAAIPVLAGLVLALALMLLMLSGSRRLAVLLMRRSVLGEGHAGHSESEGSGKQHMGEDLHVETFLECAARPGVARSER